MIRVFPRKTNATPIDDKVYFDGPGLFQPLRDWPVKVSCTFTYDKQKAEYLAEQWSKAGYKVEIGGPAYDDHGGEFVPGLFLKPGYVITSRGCNNHCWFCSVPKREGNIRELNINPGNNVLDSNLLQCSDEHIKAVFTMLLSQKEVRFTGGLEARQLKDWHVDWLTRIKPKAIYFAYDTMDDYEPLLMVSKMLRDAGITDRSHVKMCYVLIGYRGDTFDGAEERIGRAMDLGFTPMAMLYRDEKGLRSPDWISFQSHWANPTKIYGTKR